MHVHVGIKKRHAVQPSVRCCLPANGTSPKYSSTLSVDMLLSDRETLESEPLDASSDPAVGNCNRSSSVSVSMSRDLRLYTYRQISDMWNKTANSPPPPPPSPRPSFSSFEVLHYAILRDKYYENERFNFWVRQYLPVEKKNPALIYPRCSIYDSARFTICPRPLLLCAAHRRYREIVNIRILYTDIYSRHKKKIPPASCVAPHTGGKSHTMKKWSQSYNDKNLLKRNVRARGRRHARNMPCKSEGK